MIAIRRWRDITPETLFAMRNTLQTLPDGEVREIMEDVRRRGDHAVRDYSERFDGVRLTGDFAVPWAKITRAWETLDDTLRDALITAAENIRRFHAAQYPRDYVQADTPGRVMGLRHTPVARVGICVPGSPNTFPSTILMNVIPARIAGVDEIVIVTPPGKDGEISREASGAVYVAARVGPGGQMEHGGENPVETRMDRTDVRVLRIGGAQAVAALAYGTESIPAVDKIVGPGGRYVAAAKRLVSGTVGIDMFAGPSEILVLADKGSDPRHVAADMLSQAEHDIGASAVLVTDDFTLAQSVQRELALQLAELPREAIARKSLETNGAIVLTESLDEALDAVNRIAPEHLELCVGDPFALLPRVKNAGSVFLGRYAPEALGDYIAGPNHTLPTAGTARFSSPLGVADFMKKSSFVYYTREALEDVSGKIAALAECEGLRGHARSVLLRRDPDT